MVSALILLLTVSCAPGGNTGKTDGKTSRIPPVSTTADTAGKDGTSAGETTTEPATDAPKAPYLKLYVDTAKFIDNEETNETGGGSGNPIQYVDGYGCGYSSLGDTVVFENIDFGSNGAAFMTVDFSNGDKSYNASELEVRIDSLTEGEPSAVFELTYTGGWDIVHAKPFTELCAVPPGVHTIYITFTNSNSGSFDTVSFIEAE